MYSVALFASSGPICGTEHAAGDNFFGNLYTVYVPNFSHLTQLNIKYVLIYFYQISKSVDYVCKYRIESS